MQTDFFEVEEYPGNNLDREAVKVIYGAGQIVRIAPSASKQYSLVTLVGEATPRFIKATYEDFRHMLQEASRHH